MEQDQTHLGTRGDTEQDGTKSCKYRLWTHAFEAPEASRLNR